jgi:hypothetical protein
MANGRIRRHGRRGHSYEQRDGGWWDGGNPVSIDDLFRYFGKDQLIQNERGGWDYNYPRDKSLSRGQREDRLNYEMDYDKFPYDRKGNRFVRDPNAPLSKFEQIEKEFGNDDFFGGKGFWEPAQWKPRQTPWLGMEGLFNTPVGEAIPVPSDILRELPELNYARESGGIEEQNIPSMYDPISRYNRTKSNYLKSYRPGSGIDNFNSRGWNNEMKDWK